jgi:hypothetical protein
VILFFIIPREDTEYAPGYDNDKFTALNVGTDMQNVLLTVGSPLKISYWNNKGGARVILRKPEEINEFLQADSLVAVKQRWIYSKQGDATADWYLTGFEFDADGKVVEKYKDYVTD